MPVLSATGTVTTQHAPSASGSLFTDDFASYKRVYKTARDAWRAGVNPLNTFFVTQPCLGSDMSPAGNMFGVEIEYNHPDGSGRDEWWYGDGGDEVAPQIGERLYALNLVESVHQRGYHSGSSSSRAWRYEEDASVSGGEIVSPILRDTAQSWEELASVVQVLNDNDATATENNVGGHVSIDASAMVSDSATWARLGVLVSKFEDVMFRLATNPHRAADRRAQTGNVLDSTHRTRGNNDYARPFSSDAIERMGSGSADEGSFNRAHWLSAEDVNAQGYGRVEFRIFDGSLDAALIQTNVKIATAFLRAATNPALDDALAHMPNRPLGFHRQADWRKDEEGNRVNVLRGEAWKSDTLAIRQFVDMLFTENSDKEQVISLFAMNDWTWRSRPRRRNYY